MPVPNYSDAVIAINTYIIANANNEITANVLNPVLKVILDFANSSIGNLGLLTTSDTDTIVEAINSLKTDFDNLNNSGVQLLSGYNDPNITPPGAYNYADFYMELDVTDDSPIQLWQWNGTAWTTYSSVYSKAEIDAIVTELQAQIADLPSDYSNIVYVNSVSPSTATIFDINNPPVTNNNLLKNDVANLYIGNDGSTWTYNTSPAGYVTKVVSSLSNFYIENTLIDAAGNKTANLQRGGGASFGGFLYSNGEIVSKKGASNTVLAGSNFRLFNNSGTEGNIFQLNALNGVDLWNFVSGVWTKTATFSSAGNLTATSFIKSGGLSTQYLMADGSTSVSVSETTATMGALINASTSATPNNTDFVATAESGGLLKKITWTNVKAFLKTYYDTIYAAALGADDNYVTDAQLVVIGNTSGTNTGDQTTVSGNAGSATTTAITDDTTTNATMYPTWVTAITGNLAQKVSSTKMFFNSLSGLLSTSAQAIIGTGGTGFITMVGQSVNPTAPVAGTLLLHSSTVNGFTRMEQDNEAATNLVYGRDNVFIAKNTSGVTIPKGSVVYVTGSTGNVPNIAMAQANLSATLPSVAVAVDAILDNAFGQIMTIGIISSINTSAFTVGASVWVSTTVLGGLTSTRPSGTVNFVQRIGSILVSGVGNGSVMINVAPAILNMETGTNAATWTGRAIVGITFNGGTLSGNNTGDQDLSGFSLKPIQVTAQTLTAASWTLVSGFYEYNLSNANITTTSIVDVIPDNASVPIVQVAQVLPRTLSASGTVKLYSTNLPSANIVVTINIWK